MMQWIHDHMKGWGAFLLIAPLAFTFVVWGVHGLVDFSTRGERSLRVDGQDIDPERLRRAYQDRMAQLNRAFPDEVPAEIKARVQKSLVDEIVASTLLEQRVAQQRFVVTDQDVVRSIQQIPVFQVAGKFNRDAYEGLLRQQGYTPARFEAEERKSLLSRQLEAGLVLSSFVTLPELAQASRLLAERREVAFAIVPRAKYLAAIKPSEAELEAYFAAHKREYLTPETVSLSYVALRLTDLAATVTVSEEALKSYYAQVKDRYVTAEKRHARHILIQSGSDAATAEKKAREVYALATQPGADFAALAKQYSQDSGSATQGGDLDWLEKSFFVGPFADALYAMQPGEIRGPVKTQFGWHIIKLEGVQPGEAKTLAMVHEELTQEYRKAEAEKLFGERQEKLDQLAFENGGSLEPAAHALNVKVETIAGFSRAQGGAPLGAQPKLLQAAFSADVLGGQNSRAIELSPGLVVAIRASDHQMPAEQALSAVRASVETAVKNALAEGQAKAAAEAAKATLAAGGDWAATLKALAPYVTPDPAKPAAAELVRYQPAKFLQRHATEVPQPVLQAAFRLARPTGQASLETLKVGEDWAIVQVTKSEPGALLGEETPERKDLARQLSSAEVDGYLGTIRAGAEVHYNPQIFE